MNLRNLPLDTQRCTLLIGSFAYNSEETIYEWNNKIAVDIEHDLLMNQFSLIDARVGKEILIRDNRKFMIKNINYEYLDILNLSRNSINLIRCIFISSSCRLFSNSIIRSMCISRISIMGWSLVKS
jgi:hypothetical protein